LPRALTVALVAVLAAIVPASANLDKGLVRNQLVAEPITAECFQAVADAPTIIRALRHPSWPGGPNDNNRCLMPARLDFFMAANTLMSLDASPTTCRWWTSRHLPDRTRRFPDPSESKVTKLEDLSR